MTKDDVFHLHQQYVMGTYAPTIVMARGRGVRLWDMDDREYLDFAAGISVCNLGHCHPKVTEAIQRQAARLVHVSNLYLNDVAPVLAATIARGSFGGRVFFCNSGTEANEGLIKFARKWGSTRGRHEIVCMSHSFHGRTLASLAATDKPAIREGFAPHLPGFRFVPFNDLDALREAITPTTAAVLMEPVQGEGGLTPATDAFIAGARALCDSHGILLMFDEVQCGIGRTGHLFAYQGYGVEPDAMSLAKALGNGFPIGAVTVRREHEAVLGVSSHGSTFGGTALAAAAALAVFETIEAEDLLFNCRKMGEHLKGGLIQLAQKHPGRVADIRGRGLMLGVELTSPAGPILKAAQDRGLLILTAGERVLRLLPPLTLVPADIDAALAILDNALGDVQP